MRAYHKLDIEQNARDSDWPVDTDIVLDYASQGYYLVSWTEQCLFWLSEVDVHSITGSIRMTLTETHLRKFTAPIIRRAAHVKHRTYANQQVLVRSWSVEQGIITERI